ncbi:aaa family ATPase [Gigaspora margarita]|uniref:Aaa family ATPase n=1 Tax=Gigaspora margarita TaxID=4874 RepID=A0A8H4ES81_GIGMA|nr:aaa family ATPase [Gigaspora margarita]
MSKKSLRKKAIKDVPSTVVGTSGASTQSSNVTEIAENVLSLQKERSISSVGFGDLQLDFKIWVKYGDSKPTQILFEGGIVDDLKRAVKKELSPDFDDVFLNHITIRRHSEEIGLCPGLVVDRSFINDYETPL